MTARVYPNPESISIAPGKTYDCKVDFERGWTGDITPGRWTVWIEDLTSKQESDRIELPIRFTMDSVAACIANALNKESTQYKRRWHAAWLKKIDPTLQLAWPTEKMSDEGKASAEAKVQERLLAFKKFLEDDANKEAVAEAIIRINRKAGLVVDEGSEGETEAGEAQTSTSKPDVSSRPDTETP